MRIGINPLTWTNDDMPELGGDTPLEVCLQEARHAGYEGIELGHKFPRDPAILRPLLQEYTLDLISGWYGGHLLQRGVDEELAAMADHLNLLAAMGCEVLVFAEVTGAVHGDRSRAVSGRPRLSAAEWSGFAERLTALADHCQARGVRLAYHHHMGTVVEIEREIDELMRRTGESVGLLLDTGHLAYAGGDVEAVAERHKKRIAHVHCKDVRMEVLAEVQHGDMSFLDAVLAGVFTVPGDGFIDYRSLIELLNDAGYRGWLVVEAEQDPQKAHPLTYARMGFHHLRDLLSAEFEAGAPEQRRAYLTE